MADAELLARLDGHLARMDIVIEEQRTFTREMLLRFERFGERLIDGLMTDWRELRNELAEDRRVTNTQFAEANAQAAEDRRVTNAALLEIIDRLDSGGPRPAG